MLIQHWGPLLIRDNEFSISKISISRCVALPDERWRHFHAHKWITHGRLICCSLPLDMRLLQGSCWGLIPSLSEPLLTQVWEVKGRKRIDFSFLFQRTGWLKCTQINKHLPTSICSVLPLSSKETMSKLLVSKWVLRESAAADLERLKPAEPEWEASSMRGLMMCSIMSVSTEKVGTTMKSMNPDDKDINTFRTQRHLFVHIHILYLSVWIMSCILGQKKARKNPCNATIHEIKIYMYYSKIQYEMKSICVNVGNRLFSCHNADGRRSELIQSLSSSPSITSVRWQLFRERFKLSKSILKQYSHTPIYGNPPGATETCLPNAIVFSGLMDRMHCPCFVQKCSINMSLSALMKHKTFKICFHISKRPAGRLLVPWIQAFRQNIQADLSSWWELLGCSLSGPTFLTMKLLKINFNFHRKHSVSGRFTHTLSFGKINLERRFIYIAHLLGLE